MWSTVIADTPYSQYHDLGNESADVYKYKYVMIQCCKQFMGTSMYVSGLRD
jgi:hypothetical protein